MTACIVKQMNICFAEIDEEWIQGNDRMQRQQLVTRDKGELPRG